MPATPKPPQSELPWLRQAIAMLGTYEAPGAKNNPKIVELYAEAGHPNIQHDSVPWCAAFVGAMLRRAKLPSTGGLAAREYEGYGEKLKAPEFGCIGVKKRGSVGWQGHVGFVVAANSSTIWMLGGNQADRVSVAAFPRSTFTAFRWPAGQPRTKAPLPTKFAGALANASES
jgi:uncharacterized protein (TIGR02594 family)